MEERNKIIDEILVRISSVENKIVEQEHRPLTILKNFLYSKNKSKEFRVAVWISIASYFLQPTRVAISIISILSVYLLWRQNKLIEQQNFLQDASRKSSYIYQLSNTLDVLNDELSQDINENGIRDISPQLVGRIISLSQILKPYKIIENGEVLARELSPERAQLLISIINSSIDTVSLNKIFKQANFSYSDLRNSNLVGMHMEGINLRYSDLSNAFIDRSNLNNADLSYCIMIDAAFRWGTAKDAEFSFSQIEYASFRWTNLSKSVFMGATLINSNFENSNLSDACLTNAEVKLSKIANLNLDRAYFQFKNEPDKNLKSLFSDKYVKENFSIIQDSSFHLFRVIKK